MAEAPDVAYAEINRQGGMYRMQSLWFQGVVSKSVTDMDAETLILVSKSFLKVFLNLLSDS